MSEFIAVSYGGGVNSTAILIGCVEKRIKVDLITFADTGAEKPHTYDYVESFSNWLQVMGYPRITTVRHDPKGGIKETLEENCLRIGSLPSLAYGYKKCSLKFKIAPQDKFMNNHKPCKDEWKAGRNITKYIGYDSGETHRGIKDYDDKKYHYVYPLKEWGWNRKDCVDAICRAGLTQPGKSACFFCPASKPTEIRQMNAIYPDLVQRAIEIEKNANLTLVIGLGRSFSWENLIDQGDMFSDKYEEYSDFGDKCGCYDG